MTNNRLAPRGAEGRRVCARLVAMCVVAAAATLANVSAARAFPEAQNPHDVLVFGKMKVERWMVEAVVRAAEKTGVDPAYLMALADKESSFRPQVKADSSSAQGLFQFIESTWLQTLRAHGAKHGFAAAAEAITVVAGKYTVDPERRDWVLGLRCDPYLASVMAGELVRDHRERLIKETDRAPTEGELYLAHFLGPNGAARLIKLVDEKSDAKAPKAFPAAAKANKAIFYRQDAKKKGGSTVAEVHARIGAMIETRLERYEGVDSGIATVDMADASS
jgi:Transglycosylase SLT domain